MKEVFGYDYPADAPFELLNTAHVDIWGETYSDMTFKLGETVYHFECQSAAVADIDRRMLQYDFSVSLERLGTRKPSRGGLDFPTSCLVHLRRHGKES